MGLTMKLLGIFLIFAGCCMAGIELEQRLKRQWKFLVQLREVLIYLEKEMAWHRTPLPEALLQGAVGRTASLEGLLTQASEAAQMRDGRTFEAIWKEALDARVPEWELSREKRCLAEEAASAVCAHDVVMQRTLLERCISHLEEAARESEAAYREKGKLYRRLSITAGVFFVILLV